MIEFIVIIFGSLWLFYKWFEKKEIKYIFLPVLLLTLQSSWWPFFLSTDIVYGLISVFTAIFITIEYLIEKKINSVYPYVVATLGVGLYLLVKSIPF